MEKERESERERKARHVVQMYTYTLGEHVFSCRAFFLNGCVRVYFSRDIVQLDLSRQSKNTKYKLLSGNKREKEMKTWTYHRVHVDSPLVVAQ
jgi:hypothetical protein